MVVWAPGCGCTLEMDDAGEPAAFLDRCAAHADSTPSDVAAEVRARSAAQAAAADAPPT